jgi:LacI family gluconate utilization system Gnt-I transcriptional repressor
MSQRRAPKLRTDITDVARLAGVSIATVSRAINTPNIVSAETIRRVQEAIARTGYVPNLIAGGLASKRTGLIAVIVPSIAGSIFNETIEAMTGALSNSGYQVMLGLSGYDGTKVVNVLDAILARRPDGIILTGLSGLPEVRKRLADIDVPVIETWELTSKPIDMAVGFSHARVGTLIGKFVIERGYRRPCIITSDGPRAFARRAGMCKVFASKGIKDVPSYVRPIPSTVRDGRDGIEKLFNGKADFDIVICSSDWLALGAMTELQQRGLRVPDDVAVMGFGNFTMSSDLNPTLTTVHIDGAEIGKRSAELLVLRAQGRPLRKRIIDVGSSIIERAST